MIDWHHIKARPGDDPRDVEAARKGWYGTHSIDAQRTVREVREGAEKIERASRWPRPKGCDPTIFGSLRKWLRRIFSPPPGPRPGDLSIVCKTSDGDPNPFHNEETLI